MPLKFDDDFKLLPPPDVPFGAPSRPYELAFLSRFHAALRHNG